MFALGHRCLKSYDLYKYTLSNQAHATAISPSWSKMRGCRCRPYPWGTGKQGGQLLRIAIFIHTTKFEMTGLLGLAFYCLMVALLLVLQSYIDTIIDDRGMKVLYLQSLLHVVNVERGPINRYSTVRFGLRQASSKLPPRPAPRS